MKKDTLPIVLEFPLRGEWVTPNTPGTRIPSHGTNILGTRYAIDFLQVNEQRLGKPCYSASFLHYLLFGVSIEQCYCYGKAIYAPCEGIVVAVEYDYPERGKAHLFLDVRRARKNRNVHPDQDDFRKLTGNFIIVKMREGVYAALCHLQPKSIQVQLGQFVHMGMYLANIGHTGNSTFPHLHFQLMDSPNPKDANGLPCVFETYEIWRQRTWETVYNEIPKATDRIRFRGIEQ